MTTSQIYALDANVFIEAANRYYAFDIAPIFWDTMLKFGGSGEIVSPDKVKQELERGHGELANWAKGAFSSFFTTTNEGGIISCYSEVINWVAQQTQFTEAAKADFASGADGWLIALAKDKRHIVVTHEEYKADVKRKVPIPNVCRALSVQYMNTFEMLRRLKIQFN